MWNLFCEYIQLPGFRFMSSNTTLAIRLAAICVFVLSLVAMNVQLGYLIGQYLRDHVQTSTRKYRLERMAIPIVYLCHQLNGTNPLPLLELCYESVFKLGSPDLSVHEGMQRVVPICSYQLKAFEYRCELRCKWTSQGFCVEARPNRALKALIDDDNGSTETDEMFRKPNGRNGMRNTSIAEAQFAESDDEANEQIAAETDEEEALDEVSDYDIRIYFNATIQEDVYPPSEGVPALALVFLRFDSDSTKCPTKVPLVGAAHMIMERDSRNSVLVTEILKVVRNDLPDSKLEPSSSSYEFCVWRTYSELNSNGTVRCPSEYMTDFFSSEMWQFLNTTYNASNAQCALARALKAQQSCREDREFNRFTVETAIYTRGEADTEAPAEDRLLSSPNLHIFPGDVMMQETLHQFRSNVWKTTSEFGGTLSLYVGFTLMSLLEIVLFCTVAKVRQVAETAKDEAALRRHPPVKSLPKAIIAQRRKRRRRKVGDSEPSTY